MHKTQLTEALAKAENITLKKAEMVINAVFENMAEALAREEHIEILGFGSFKVKVYKGYKGRNPKTGDLIKVDGKKLPVFEVGQGWQRTAGTRRSLGYFSQPGRGRGGAINWPSTKVYRLLLASNFPCHRREKLVDLPPHHSPGKIINLPKSLLFQSISHDGRTVASHTYNHQRLIRRRILN
jgi:integration host factor subunit beta